jgi:hypothetical protein
MFDMMAMQAGWDWSGIRETTWDGILKRAEKGGDRLMLRAVPMPGYQLKVVGHSKIGVPIRVPEKCPDEQALAEHVCRIAHEMPSANSTCKRLNREGRLRPARRSGGTREWVVPDLLRMLRNPIYKGVLCWGERREQARRRGDLSAVLDNFKPTRHIVPDLAFVTASIWQRVNDKLAPGRPKSAEVKNTDHVLSGVLLCPRCQKPLVGGGRNGYNCRLANLGLCVGFIISDGYAEAQACQIVDDLFARVNLPEHYERVLEEQGPIEHAKRRATLEAELRSLPDQEDALADAVAQRAISESAARRKTHAIESRRVEIEDELEALGQERDAVERATLYASLVRSRGVGRMVLAMPSHDRRRFFRSAFRSLTLDRKGRGRWRTREIVGYELSDVT